MVRLGLDSGTFEGRLLSMQVQLGLFTSSSEVGLVEIGLERSWGLLIS